MSGSNIIKIGDIPIGGGNPLAFILGPCQLENRDHAMFMAEKISKVCSPSSSNFIFKSSFDKANRSSIASARGVGIEEGLKILEEVKLTFNCPVITDIHSISQCASAAEVVDILQIPAFLSRQTDLLLAAGETGKPVNVKKGQFLAPWEMTNVAEKIASTGNKKILLCERGTSFGYNTLVNDMRGLHEMKKTGYPVVIDATHSCQQPGGQGTSSGGNREHIPVIASAAVAVGVAGVFIEVHDDPDNAASDGPNNLHLKDLEKLLVKLKALDKISKSV